MARDSILGTLLVAFVLCVVCSVLVSAAAVLLNPRQQENKALYEKTNILRAAGLIGKKATAKEVETIYESRVRKLLVNLDEAKVVPTEEVPYDDYNPRDAADDDDLSKEITVEGPTPGVDRRPNMLFLYEVMAEGSETDVEQYVLPIYGKGLWSTLYGFLAIQSDGVTIKGITFYEHGETPGLGGEVENPNWQAQWDGKLAYNEEGEVIVRVVKGTVEPGSEADRYAIDGLSGATITTNGVSNFVRYWLGPDGFGPFLKKQTGGQSHT
jgi:Na+-transporting NADH:ubiquinone oxidoreductase subunit C